VDLYKTTDKFDLVLMDIKMPVMDGYEATKNIRDISPNQVIIAQTAYTSTEDREKIKLAGFNHYLSKPISPQKLLQTLGRYLSE
jgi:CheY-like chemotaxis protein